MHPLRLSLAICLLVVIGALVGCAGAASKPPPTATPRPTARSLSLYMYENSRDASWYGNIERYEAGSPTRVYTNLYPKESNKPTAQSICAAVASLKTMTGESLSMVRAAQQFGYL